jgi:hypothetical protein
MMLPVPAFDQDICLIFWDLEVGPKCTCDMSVSPGDTPWMGRDGGVRMMPRSCEQSEYFHLEYDRHRHFGDFQSGRGNKIVA